HADSALIDVSDHHRRIVEVGTGAEVEYRTGASKQLDVGHALDKLIAILDCCRAVKLGLKRLNALRVDGFFVHARVVEITNLPLNGAALRIFRGLLLQYVPQDLLIAYVDLREAVPCRLVGRNRTILPPSPTSELIEVDARVNAAVEVRGSESAFVACG